MIGPLVGNREDSTYGNTKVAEPVRATAAAGDAGDRGPMNDGGSPPASEKVSRTLGVDADWDVHGLRRFSLAKTRIG